MELHRPSSPSTKEAVTIPIQSFPDTICGHTM